MASYRFDTKSFVKTLCSFMASGVFFGTLFGVFWEDKPADKLADIRKEPKEKVFLGLIVRDSLVGLGIGTGLGLVMGGVGALSKRRNTHIWGE